MITQALQAEIERELNARIGAIAPLSAANNAQIYGLKLATGATVVAKVAERGLEVEAFMLRYLKTRTPLPVPEVYFSNEHVIIMQYINAQGGVDGRVERHAAELLAGLHQIRAEKFGFERDTAVGSLLQPNPETADWGTFYAEHRLLHMARKALAENKIDAKTMKQVEKLAAKVPGMLKGGAGPSLVHGDIWGGNLLVNNGRIAAFLDPAIYFADPEVELAFIRLFRTFDATFFSHYRDINPIRPGFDEERADIYALYPLLVHTRLFGMSYARKAMKIIDRFA